MIYDRNLQKGVKKIYIPPPTIFSFPSNATYLDVILKGIERFFPEEIQSPDLFCLTDSSGIPYNIEQKNKINGLYQNLFKEPGSLPVNFICM